MIPSCRDVAEQATEYQEGAMSFWKRLAFRFHLGLCKGCRALLAQLALTAAMVRRLPRPAVPGPTRDTLLVAFRGRRTP